MAEETEGDVLDLTPDMEADGEQEEQPAEQQDEGEEFAIELEGEEQQEETPLIRQLRDEVRATKRELSEYRKQAQPKVEIGKKPDLWEDCEGDADRFEQELTAWQARKRQAEEGEREAEQQANVRNEEFQRAVGRYRAKAAALPVQDFDAAETAIRATLPELLQSAIVTYADNPATVVYALYKHPAKLAALAAEPDPVRAIIAIRDMERNLKVTTRKPPPPPMSGNIQRGSAPMSVPNYDKQLAKLEEDASRTGKRDKVIEFKRLHKEKAK